MVTVEEFLAMEEPEDGHTQELIDGIIEDRPVGTLRHSAATMNMAALLMGHASTREGRAFTELGKSYATSRPNHRVPDLSYFAAGRVPDLGELYPQESPDLVAEVRSPRQSRRLLVERLRFLIEQGAKVGLLVDPEDETVTVFEGGAERTFLGDEEVNMDALPGFAFQASALFK
jgi:Uma2 family endonuclease